MRKRFYTFLILALMCTPLTIKADTTQTFNNSSGLTDATTVTATKDASFSVTVPKDISMTKEGTSSYSVNVTGDVGSSTVITVAPIDDVVDVDGINFKISEALGLKSDIIATVQQEKQSFAYDEISAGSTTTGTISCSGLSAGSWSGILKFNIAAGTGMSVMPAGLYSSDDVLLIPWDTLLADGILTVTDGELVANSDELDTLAGKLVIEDTVTTLGDCALEDCVELTYIYIYIYIPDSVTNIGHYAFSYCKALIDVDIPDSVLSIGDSAFSWCSSLTSIDIPASCVSIGTNALSSCTSLSSIAVNPANTVYDSRNSCNAIIDTETATLQAGCLSTVIPEDIVAIGDGAFEYLPIAQITIPDSVTIIGDSAFNCCERLQSVVMSSNIRSLGVSCFYKCTMLKKYSNTR